MQKTLLPGFIVLILFCTLSCDYKVEVNTSGTEGIEESVKAMLHKYDEDIRKYGLEAEFKYLDSTNQFFWVPPGFNSYLSYDSVMTIVKKNAAAIQSMNNTWEYLKVEPISDEYAIYTGKLKSITTDTSGQTIENYLLETGVVVKRENDWKLLCGQTNVIPR